MLERQIHDLRKERDVALRLVEQLKKAEAGQRKERDAALRLVKELKKAQDGEQDLIAPKEELALFRFVHHCKRCEQWFGSRRSKPRSCRKCGTTLWNKDRVRKSGAGRKPKKR